MPLTLLRKLPVLNVLPRRGSPQKRKAPLQIIFHVKMREHINVMRLGVPHLERRQVSSRGLAALALGELSWAKQLCRGRSALAVITAEQLDKLRDLDAAGKVLRKQVGGVDVGPHLPNLYRPSAHFFLHPQSVRLKVA